MSAPINSLDNEVLEPWLVAHIEGFHDLMEIKKFEGGQSNPTFLIKAQSGKYVLRAKPPGELLKSAHQVDREYRVMKALANTAVPVPKVFALSDEDSPIGRMFFVMEFLDGHIFWDPALPEVHEYHGEKAPERRALIYDRMNIALAALHNVDVNAVGLSDFGKPGSYFERQVDRWSKQYAASEVDENKDIHRLIKWLGNHMPADDGQVSLVHGDYRLDNMVFSHDAHNVIGVLDWELSTLGHPLADLAYQCMQWRLPHQGGFRGLGGLDRTPLGLPSERDYVASYCKRRNIGEIDNWHFYVAFCFFRLAAILQGVYKRSLDGNASNPEKAKQYGVAVPILGHLAMEMIDKGE
ncbi:MAG: phosphotransferase [Salaquimonas sp.]